MFRTQFFLQHHNSWTLCIEQYAYYHIPNLHVQLVKDAPEGGPVRSETCRASKYYELNQTIKEHIVSSWPTYTLQDDTRSLKYQGENLI
jgi:hypothetical protein